MSAYYVTGEGPTLMLIVSAKYMQGLRSLYPRFFPIKTRISKGSKPLRDGQDPGVFQLPV